MSDEEPTIGPNVGKLEPYGAQIFLGLLPAGFAPGVFLEALLEDIASGCTAQGATVIGHLKCFFRSEGVVLRCNLTSLRSGAKCFVDADSGALASRREGASPAAACSSGAETSLGAELDLAVLVYGVPAAAIDGVVEEALASRLAPMGVSWGKRAAYSRAAKAGD